MRRPHQGNVTRDIKIFILWDTGEHSHKEIASLITMQGYRCSSQTVRDALKRRKRYAMFYQQAAAYFSGVR